MEELPAGAPEKTDYRDYLGVIAKVPAVRRRTV